MSKGTNEGPLVDQIIEAWFADLRKSHHFDSATLERLRELAARGRLKRSADLIKAIQVAPGGEDEDH